MLDRLAEEEPKLGTPRAEVALRREREVDLQAAGEQEDAVDRRLAQEVEEVGRVELKLELPRPLVDNVHDRHAVGDAEGQVEIRPAVSRPMREPADDRAGDDPR